MFRHSPNIAEALRRGINRVEAWGWDSKLRVNDVRAYLTWQVEALGEALSWYYEENWLRHAVDEYVELPPSEALPRTSEEIIGHGKRMLRCGRFDDFDWSENEGEDPPRKRRRMG